MIFQGDGQHKNILWVLQRTDICIVVVIKQAILMLKFSLVHLIVNERGSWQRCRVCANDFYVKKVLNDTFDTLVYDRYSFSQRMRIKKWYLDLRQRKEFVSGAETIFNVWFYEHFNVIANTPCLSHTSFRFFLVCVCFRVLTNDIFVETNTRFNLMCCMQQLNVSHRH